ncbi:MAG: hypothetical protein EOO63_15760, partial [Hymenobacter sp.]
MLSAAFPSQGQATIPLHAFFQQNFDSTIVYQSSSTWNRSPNYLILAKHQNQLDFFTYRSPYRDVLGRYFPGKLVQKISQEELRFRAATPDTNRYLLPQRVASEVLRRSWQRLNPPSLWAIQGDSAPTPKRFEDPWVEAIDFVRRTDAQGRRKVIILEVQTDPYGGNYEQIPSVHREIRAAIADGCVVCVAAGNGDRPVD